MKIALATVTFCYLCLRIVFVARAPRAQTFEINGQQQRAVQAAPQNADLWFLLGYTSRLAGHFQQSLEAYRPGLAAHPNSAEGRYDNVQSGFLISYLKPWRRTLQDATGQVPVEYPLRFSFGITTDDFFNFAGRGQTLVRPVVRLTLY